MDLRSPVTLADIAEAAHVSVGTVSRVLNGRKGSIKISQATISRVMEAAQRLGYQPNPFATALRTQRTGVLGAILRDMGDPFLSKLARALQQAAHEQGFELLLGHADYDAQTAQRQLTLMLNRWFDGLLLLGNLPDDATLLMMVQQSRTPCVAVASGAKTTVPLVALDEERGALLGLEYLFHLGHRRLAFVGTIEHAGVSERLATFRHFVKDRGLEWHEGYEQCCAARTPGDATERLRQLLARPRPPTAIFCASDALALRAMSVAWQLGFHLPAQLSILGFDDIEQAAESVPPLTTIRQPVSLMAQEAVSMLRDLIDGSANERQEYRRIVKPELIVRASCSSML
ncbi:LacI family transcriptional regulator [Ktedonosporobacter rubrisoli]|uniref:LacI family transcriptional regulator n=1 Tax=Ktedonosporobacter rubrisoli TaxID=2509675 RepID=A0A4P6JLD0_KTERU|nr:LacI family DNA-binding transcriptional regulator [Ktedonosporobacter rubrisoli]QBD75995.1 LacI family transcriptional regulator [Ktedonosporobacter rubrisoli]